jgi:hypothetical protein
MATARPFAINPGAPINGTIQVGTIAVGTPNIGFEATGLKWYNGPDEDLGYVIASDNEFGTLAPDGTIANVQFWRAASNSDSDFIDLVKSIIPGTYANVSAAKAALAAADFWTNFEVPVASTFGYTFLTGTSYPLSSNGSATLKIDNPTSEPKYIWLRGNSTYLTSGTNSGSATLNGNTITISNTITGTNQTFDSGSYLLVPANTLNLQFTVSHTGVGSIQLTYTDANTPSRTNVPMN